MNPLIGINLPNNSVNPEDTRRYFAAFCQAGFNAVEISLDTYPLIIDGEPCRKWIDYVHGMLDEFPFRYSAHIGRGLDLRDLKNKEKHQAVLKNSIDIAAELGMSPLVLHYEVQSRNREVEAYFLQAHKEAAAYAEQKGVLIVVENIEVELVEPVIELVDSVNSKNLKLAFDTGHAFLASHYFKFDYIRTFKKTLPYLAHLHLSDNTGVFEELRLTDRPKYDSLPMGYRYEYGRGDIHLPPYFGKIPYDELFALTKGYQGMYICEYYVERFMPFMADVQSMVSTGIARNQ
ncbi:MAG: sugar phosphate isomerase/epimerase [Spirochaetaceae bacterium]|nr:sugar phosphate isomerase/epimerase [Spirochaetaceae bacterium]